MEPDFIIITTRGIKARYEATLRAHQQYHAELLELPSRAHLRRYKIRRKLGDSRLRILAPRLAWRRQKLRDKYTDWKHRKDPTWLM